MRRQIVGIVHDNGGEVAVPTSTVHMPDGLNFRGRKKGEAPEPVLHEYVERAAVEVFGGSVDDAASLMPALREGLEQSCQSIQARIAIPCAEILERCWRLVKTTTATAN